jgi:RNA polymerase sigma-70 factor (ECF subfamily)
MAGSSGVERPYRQRMHEPSFPEIYERLVPSVRARARRMVGPSHAAEDIVQETFLRLWRGGPELAAAGPAAMAAWLRRTCTRLALDALRSRRRERRWADGESPPRSLAGADEALLARAALAEIARTVPADELEAALLSRVDGRSHGEIAAALGVSERTVRRKLRRFDERLGGLLDESSQRPRNQAPRRALPLVAIGLLLMLATLVSARSCAARERSAPVDHPGVNR